MRIVLATHNRDKAGEIRAILEGLDVTLLTLDEFPGAPETVEDADTLEGNALKKAREIRAFTGLSALADDTGLEVDALDGAPGVYSARFASPQASYEENRQHLLERLEGVPETERGARFRTVMALALSPDDAARLTHAPEDTDALTSEGILPGSITTEPLGSGGFGYDPVFYHPAAGRTLSEMSAQEKNRTSHRYRALVEMRAMILREGLAGEVAA
jgi:XTP/dITP diphosphohydrolase